MQSKILNRKVFTAIFALIVLALLIVVARIDNKMTWQSVYDVSDQLSFSLRSQLNKERDEALQFALVLSHNRALVKALEDEDEDEGYELLSSIMKSVSKYTQTLVRTQVITADYRIFARSWDSAYAGMMLGEHRSDLLYFKSNKNPRTSIEVGRRLGIKATVPIYKESKLLGFVEVLNFFDSTTSFFRNFGIDMYVLMDYDFYDLAVLMQNNPVVGEFIVANRSYNARNLKMLERSDLSELQKRRVVAQEDQYIFYEQMKNGDGDIIGMFAFVMPKKNLDYFGSKDEEVSFLINFSRKNLYDIVKKEQYASRVYASKMSRELLQLKEIVSNEDRELFLEDARQALNLHTKDEIISMLLNHGQSGRITGDIR